jgi:hypothetical protein
MIDRIATPTEMKTLVPVTITHAFPWLRDSHLGRAQCVTSKAKTVYQGTTLVCDLFGEEDVCSVLPVPFSPRIIPHTCN